MTIKSHQHTVHFNEKGLQVIDEQKLMKVLAHQIENHGLTLCAEICGRIIWPYKLQPTTTLLGVETTAGVSFTILHPSGSTLKFTLHRQCPEKSFQDWLTQASENLSTEKCQDFAVIPVSIPFDGGVSEWKPSKKAEVAVANA